MKEQKAFTLIELLVITAILAVLGSVTVVILNPTELLAQGRDSQRMNDTAAIVKSLSLAKFDNPNLLLGVTNVVYKINFLQKKTA